MPWYTWVFSGVGAGVALFGANWLIHRRRHTGGNIVADDVTAGRSATIRGSGDVQAHRAQGKDVTIEAGPEAFDDPKA